MKSLPKTNPYLFYAEGECPGAPGLKGRKCRACKHYTLEASAAICPQCFAEEGDEVCIGQRGTIVGFSLVMHPIPPFKEPYVVAFIRIDEGPVILAPVLTTRPEALSNGDRVTFLLRPADEKAMLSFAYLHAGVSTT